MPIDSTPVDATLRSRWAVVDDFLSERLAGPDSSLNDVLAASARAGLPHIEVSTLQGKFLHLLVRMTGARRVLEIGTLGGFSAINMARALPDDGELITLEADPRHAEVARTNVEQAGLSGRIQVVLGRALDTLPGLEGPFDLFFIDADKPNNPSYLREALRLSRPGTVIVIDNVVRGGRVTDVGSEDGSVAGTRAVLDLINAESRLDATALQTVGGKGWDGFALALVRS